MAERHTPERRGGVRFLACFPGAVVRPDGVKQPALIRNLSIGGALLLVDTARVASGDRMDLHLFIHDDLSRFISAPGKIVRVEPLPLEQRGPWVSRVAVQFDEPLTSHESQINSFRKNHVWEED